MTQREFAEALGKAAPRLSGWENDRAVPRTKQLRAIAELTSDPEAVYRWLVGGGVLLAKVRRMGAVKPEGPPAAADFTDDEEQIRAMLRAVEVTVRGHTPDPGLVRADPKALRLFVLDQMLEGMREEGRPVPDFLFRLRYEIEKDLFR